ncbi:MAG: hypothetical protein LC126_04140 [Bryobacterales bacterium]|nr:hypothetical protein [Bryobacterales bacterium]
MGNPQTGKLIELRAKTDRELLVLLAGELRQALHASSLSGLERAARTYRLAAAVLPTITQGQPGEIGRVSAQLDELHARLITFRNSPLYPCSPCRADSWQ